MKTLAVIPARLGSIRLPDKNIRPFCGKPLVQWTIEAAIEAACITDVVMCTNDQRVKDVVAASLGVSSYEPPDHDFESGAVDATVKTVRDWQSYAPDFVIMLLPTSPLRTAAHIDAAFDQFMVGRWAKSLNSVIPADIDLRTLRVKDRDEWGLKGIDARGDFYRSNGAIQIALGDAFPDHSWFINPFQFDVTMPYVMTPEEGIDIDTAEDFERAVTYAEAKYAAANV